MVKERTREELPTPRLRALAKASATWGPFAEDFELERDGAGAALAWFDGKADGASRFVVFGRDDRGGLYAFWLREGKTPPDAPVVHLGDEGDCEALAKDEGSFLASLAAREGAPGRAQLLSWLEAEGIPPADEDDVRDAVEGLTPLLTALVEAVMAGRAVVDAAPPAAEAGATEIPIDPVVLLGGPAPKVKLPKRSGLEIIKAAGKVTTLFITPGLLGATLRPGGIDVLAASRAELREQLGPPDRTAAGYDRWDRGDVAWHVQWKGDRAQMLTLMWRPALPEHLR